MLNIYKASAGSGKTFTLAYQYIKLLLGRRDNATGLYRLNSNPRNAHRHILAITFTVKATEEMKQRIIHELAVLAGREPGWTKPSDYLGRLTTELHCTAADLRRAADVALSAILYDFSFFSISTIDSFFQTVLRTFAREAELTGNYDVEIDDQYAIAFGVNEMLSSLNRRGAGDPDSTRLGGWLYSYMMANIDKGRVFNIFNRDSSVHSNLISFIRDMTGEEFMRNYDRMMDYLADKSRIVRFAEQLAEQSKRLRDEVTTLAVAADTAINQSPSKSLVTAHLSKFIAKWTDPALSPKSLGKTAAKVADDITAAFKKGYSPGSDAALEHTIAAAVDAIIAYHEKKTEIDAVASHIHVLGLLSSVFDHIEDFCKENDTILLKDTTSLLRGIIGDADAPFVYERIGQWFNHFLIDEFQDTSQLQWENLKPLLDESLSHEADYDNLIIGDEKQCIYRFRDSDPSLLANMADNFGSRAALLNNTLEGNTNWRSSADVIRVNNTVFRLIANATGLEGIYGNVTQPVSPKHADHRGFVKFNRVDTDADFDAATYEQLALDNLVADVAAELAAGYRPADIAVLVRRRDEGAKVIETLMSRRAELGRDDIRVVSDDALMVNSSPSVRLIVSVLRFIANQQLSDTTPVTATARKIARLVNRYEKGVSAGLAPGDALGQAVNDTTDIDMAAAETIGMKCINLPSIVERIIARYIPAERLDDENLFITAFQDLVVAFTSRGSADIHSFLKWWDTAGCKSSVASAPDASALRVMTIHKSKGLEFKCVHVPFMTKKVPTFKGPAWFEPGDMGSIPQADVPPLLPIMPAKWMQNSPHYSETYDRLVKDQLVDEINVAYVALTRAIDRLSVTYTPVAGRLGFYLDEAIQCATPATVATLSAKLEPSSPLAVDPFVELAANVTTTPEGLTVYTIGSPAGPRPEPAKPRTALDPHETIMMPPFTTDDRDDLWANTKVDDLPDLASARERGKMLHRVLELVTTASSVSKAAATAMRRGHLSPDDSALIVDEITSQINSSPLVASWFNGYRRVLMERPVHIGNGQTRRPDRIVWTADGHIDVIDYKFGQRDDKKYNPQVAAYMAMMRRAGHSEGLRGFVWYVAEGLVVPVG